MSWSNYAENVILDAWFGQHQTIPTPATWYVGLATVTIIEADTGSTVTEPTGNGYARATITNGTGAFGAAAGGSKTNLVNVDFDNPTGSWGTIVDFFVADAATAGNVIGYGTLGTPAPIDAGSAPVRFGPGDLTITQD